MFRAAIVDTFQITGRGLVVAVNGASNLPVGRALEARVIFPDDTSLSCTAFKEWLLRRKPIVQENEAFLLKDVDAASIAAACYIEIKST